MRKYFPPLPAYFGPPFSTNAFLAIAIHLSSVGFGPFGSMLLCSFVFSSSVPSFSLHSSYHAALSLVFLFFFIQSLETYLWRPWMPSPAPSSSQESQMRTLTTQLSNCPYLLLNQTIIELGL